MQTNPRWLGALVVAATSLVSCGGAVAASATPIPSCSGDPRPANPTIVGLSADARLDLEAAMKRGVVVVHYDCTTLRVVDGCTLAGGGYAYAGVKRRETVVKMSTKDELSANLPFSGGRLGAQVESGRQIELALVVVGKQAITFDRLALADLKGTCDGATHFLQQAEVGAFAMSTASVGKTRAVSELFEAGASASSESHRNETSSDGSLASCRTSDAPAAPRPPTDCRAPIDLTLVPLTGR